MNSLKIFRLPWNCPQLHFLTTKKSSIIRPISVYVRVNMSDKPNTVLNAEDSWFNKYKTVEGAPDGVFKGVKDRFDGITVDSNMETCTEIDFETQLKQSLAFWSETKRRGVWFKVHTNHSAWVPVLAKYDFNFHHAKKGFVMMCRWLPADEPYNIPPFAHSMVGVGAIVINDKNEILVVSERHALVKNSWKLPGGYLEPNEDIVDAGMREILEETNISTKFDSLVAIRHAHGAGFGCSDLYIVVALIPLSNEIVKCEREIAKCEWMPVAEYLEHPSVHELNRSFVRTYLKYKEDGIKIACREDIHQILKKKYFLFNAEIDKNKL